MGVDRRRDHGFRVPRPDVAVATGAPDACTDCHGDRDAAWAAAEIERRFPASTHRGPSFATAFAAARLGSGGAGGRAAGAGGAGGARGDRAGERARPADAGDRSRGSPTRGAAARRSRPAGAGRGGGAAAGRAAGGAAGAAGAGARDPLRAVRVAAAKATLGRRSGPAAPEAAPRRCRRRPASGRRRCWSRRTSPRPTCRSPARRWRCATSQLAEAAFREAVELDPQLVDGWAMIARIRAATGDAAGRRGRRRRRARGQSGAAGAAGLQAQLGP